METAPDQRARREPTGIGELIKEVMREMAPVVEALPRGKGSARGGDRLAELQGIWQRIVGAEIAALARITRYRGGVLTVEVDSAPLKAELEGFAKAELTESFIDGGLDGLHELRFRSSARRAEPEARETNGP